MFSTYKEKDVTLLLTDITGKVSPQSTEEREKLIQSGVHYSEMLPIEYEPTEKYMELYKIALDKYSEKTAEAVMAVAEKIWAEKGEDAVLVSLARAGISIGVLIKRYIAFKYKKDVAHYAVSIIRGKGIDRNAMDYILKKHRPCDIQFVDGWTGKGAIRNQLEEAMKEYTDVNPGIAVLSDPAHLSEKCGTHEDFLIASSCLNSTVSGLISRTFYKESVIEKDEYHGVCFYKELADKDVTYQFIDLVEKYFSTDFELKNEKIKNKKSSKKEVDDICLKFDINDINLVKPSIGETTRVLLRRVPWKILVHSMDDEENLGHIYQLAKEKNVDIEIYPLENYKACGLIKTMADN